MYSIGYTQTSYPKNYFSSPLKIPIILAGTFGELRSNHFHSGIDIKTQGKEGIPIYAPADGYVSRLKVSQYGFGKALYLNHPNGYTTVYAHLQKYSAPIDNYIKGIQYQKKSYYTGNIFPKPEKFPVKKGDLIGYCGDTGSSSAPHLHYEIRDTKTEHVINPLLFGLEVTDTKGPTLLRVAAFPLDEQSRVNGISQTTVLPVEASSDGNYNVERITAYGTIGLGIVAYDKLDDANNKNGLYSLDMFVNGTKVYHHDVETFSFSESKYINLFIDYEHYKTYRTRIQKTYREKANRLSIYDGLINDGKLFIEPNKNYVIELVAKDLKGNMSIAKLPIKGVPTNTLFKQKDTTAYKIIAPNFHKFTKSNVTVAFPKHTFYDDIYLDFEVSDSIAKIHSPTVPLDKRFTLTFDTSEVLDSDKPHIYIANVTKEKYPRYVSTKRKENKVYTTSKTLGTYTLKLDNTPPSIQLKNFENNKWISALETLVVKIKDNESGIKDYKATINGKWVLMEYNHKKGHLTYDFKDKKLVGTKHIFKLVVSDNVGNTNSISTIFFRKKNKQH